MKDSYGTYDGRKPEPPYHYRICADCGALHDCAALHTVNVRIPDAVELRNALSMAAAALAVVANHAKHPIRGFAIEAFHQARAALKGADRE